MDIVYATQRRRVIIEIAVCDDNKLFLSDMEQQLQTINPSDNISLFSDLAPFLMTVEGGKRYDAVLMDIDWHNRVAGMDAAEEIYKISPCTKIIYITGFIERFSQQIFLQRANLSGYLTKPVDGGLLRANLQKVADAKYSNEEDVLVLKQKGAVVSVSLREIYFIESRNHVILVHTDGDVVRTYDRLENILRSLTEGFFQCHKSYIINMGKVRRFQSDDVILKNGANVPVSRARYALTKEAYLRYLTKFNP
jgi:DNA-binding LytR/AlgR family response regulator